ncbi:MAG: non-homologous end-joining DNA ligase [Azospirillaceae bacterium]
MTDGVLTLDGRKIAVSNQDKVLFPADGITKGDLVDYYRRVAPTALPHWRGRPVTMQRFPDGIERDGFFQKQAPDHFPGWITRVTLDKEDGTVTHLLIEDAATAVYLADQACITPHLALSRADAADRPDRLVIDLDPSDDDFEKVRFAAKTAGDLLAALDLPAFAMTTGSRGLHVVVPLARSAGFDAARAFARDLAGRLADAHPDTLTVEQRRDRRGDRVYLDVLRNAYGQTAVAPYAVRAKPGAPVATPIRWRELDDPRLGPRRWTIANLFRRLGQTEDPWAGIDRRAVAMDTARDRLARLG